MTGKALLRKLRAALEAEADPERALQMQAYMKSALPYHGVAMPTVRAICREQLADVAFEDGAHWQRAVLELFEAARFREEWYAAVALCRHRSAKSFQTPEAMSLFEKLIVGAAWWDVVDELASHCVGSIVLSHPRVMKPMMRAWSCDANLWKRRTSILCQLRAKEQTDVDLLYACIEPSLSSKEFFLRKAIGWALREYAKTDPEEVRRYVREHSTRLSPLSTREALKNVGPG